MMVLDVLMFTYAKENPHGYPADWPMTCKEMDSRDPKPSPPWVRMTIAEYEAYRGEPKRAKAANEAGERAKKARGPK
jgi:hypothetical protein